MNRPRLLRPDRLRTLERPFGWIPFRLLTSGWLPCLGRETKLLYFFLCLVADGRGISFYGDARMCRLLGLTASELGGARKELCGHDMLAFDGRVYQLLSLPKKKTPVQPSQGRRGSRPEPVGRILKRMIKEA